MTTAIQSKINTLPLSAIKEVDDFVDFLLSKQGYKTKIKERKFGCAKGMFTVHDDFNEPLDDFKEYI
jgi:hypothetical protein